METRRYFLYHIEHREMHEVSEDDFRDPPKWSNGNAMVALVGDSEDFIPQYDIRFGGAFGQELVALINAVSRVQERLVLGKIDSPSGEISVAIQEGVPVMTSVA